MENSIYPIEPIIKLLVGARYIRLAEFLKRTHYLLNVSSTFGSMVHSLLTTVEIVCSPEQHVELSQLSDKERKKLLEAFHALYPIKEGSIEICDIIFLVKAETNSTSRREATVFDEDEQSQKKLRMRKTFIKELLKLGSIEGNLELIEFLKLTWRLDEIPSTDRRFQTATEDIRQHVIGNDDWGYEYLLVEYLGVGKDDKKFFAFLKSLVDFSVRGSSEQEVYASLINSYLQPEGYKLEVMNDYPSYKSYEVTTVGKGVDKSVKNLIFASGGQKPEIVLEDALNNDIRIVKNAEHCLIYDLPIPITGLLWVNLVDWWAKRQGIKAVDIEVERQFYSRLEGSLSSDSPPERLLFRAYFKYFRERLKDKLPALIPQVYLHYDPKTVKELYGNKRLPRQRMDFLMLLPGQQRIVIEVDGKQHYADGREANTRKYAEMVAADRQLRLNGYEIYRFGGYELPETDFGSKTVKDFFQKLLEKHGIM